MSSLHRQIIRFSWFGFYFTVAFYVLRYTFTYWLLILAGFLLAFGAIVYSVSCIGVPKLTNTLSKRRKFKFVNREEWKLQVLSLTSDTDKLHKPITESFLISETIDELIDLIIKSFIDGWFHHISTSTLLQDDIRIELKSVIEALLERLQHIDFARLLVTRLIPIVHEHFQHFVSAKQVVLSKNTSTKVDSSDYHVAVAKHYNRGKLHPGVTIGGENTQINEKTYLRTKLGKILPFILSESERNNDISVSLVTELLSCTILASILQMVGEGDFYNLLIAKQIGTNLRHIGQVKQLRAALEEQTHQLGHKNSMRLDRLSKDSNDKQITMFNPGQDINIAYQVTEATKQATFANMVKSINAVTSTQELKEIEKSVMFQLSKVSTSTNGKKMSIIKKLQALKTAAQARHEELASQPKHTVPDKKVDDLQLQEVLHQPSVCNLFAEYLKYLNKLYLLHFLQACDSLKAPLEDATLDEEGGTDLSISLEFATVDDIKNVFYNYLVPYDFDIDYDKQLFENMISHPEEIELYKKCRKLLFRLQRDVYQNLNQGLFQSFKRSTIFSKLVNMESFKENNKPLVSQPISVENQDTRPVSTDVSTDVSPEVLTAIENAFSQIMQNPTNDTYDLHKDNSSSSTLDDYSYDKNSTINMKKDLFGESSSLFGGDNRSSKLFDDISDDSTDNDSENLEGEASHDEASDGVSNDLSDSQVFLAAPGDLSLAEEISKLNEEIENFNEQLLILDSLIKKAEITNNTTELRILRKSRVSLDREINVKELQKQQYIVQENDNSLYGKSNVTIQSYISGNENGKEFILYIVEVQKLSSDDPNIVTAGWIVARRFSQFFKLHEYLRSKYPQVNNIKFPKRTMSVLKFQQRSLVDLRKAALEEYLQQLINIPQVCSNKAFRSFLSSENFNIRKNQVFEENPKNNIETVANKLYNGISNRFVQASPNVPESSSNDEVMKNIKDMQKELKIYDETGSGANQGESKVFVKPICDFLIAIFRLNNTRSWLRGRALVVILQRLFGTTIEKKVNELINKQLKSEDSILDLLLVLKNTLFPNGKFKDPPVLRSIYEQAMTKQEAKVLLNVFMNETCSKIFGTSNASYASNNIFSMLQNEYLNKHLLLELFDEILDTVFES